MSNFPDITEEEGDLGLLISPGVISSRSFVSCCSHLTRLITSARSAFVLANRNSQSRRAQSQS
jgi:hypothetical protein